VGRSAICLVVLAARTARADCTPAAIAQGDPALVQELVAKLRADGIATAATDGCPSVQVAIDHRGEQVHLRLADAFQRTSERDVQDLATAAAVVESWTYQVVDAGSLPAEPPPVPEAPHLVHSGIAASAMSSLGSNGGTTWIGGSLGACVRLDPVCAGVALHAQKDTTATGETTTLLQDSYALAAFATIDLPRRLGDFVVTPGIAVGYSYLHVITHHHDSMGNLLDVPSPDHQLRGAIHAMLLRPIGTRLAVFADLWGDGVVVRSDSNSFGPAASLVLALGLRVEAP